MPAAYVDLEMIVLKLPPRPARIQTITDQFFERSKLARDQIRGVTVFAYKVWECLHRWDGSVRIGGMAVSTSEAWQCSLRRHSSDDIGGVRVSIDEAWQCRHRRHGSLNIRGIAVST
ncbi:hypothetical protein EV426DRAFT_698874 [Tirmania nivea]|nr:hypothetical protein EV426DRAFT_698874 [Tirmania nivea]